MAGFCQGTVIGCPAVVVQQRAVLLLLVCGLAGCLAAPRRERPKADAGSDAKQTAQGNASVATDGSTAPPSGVQNDVAPYVPLHELDGIYMGPDEAYVVVQRGYLRELELFYAGNAQLNFTAATLRYGGMREILSEMFMVDQMGIVIRGTFTRPGRIDGTWEDGKLRGTWYANRVTLNPNADARNPDVRREDAAASAPRDSARDPVRAMDLPSDRRDTRQ
jgi:hypothetical protein